MAKYVVSADGICQKFFDNVDNQLWQSTKGKHGCGDQRQVVARWESQSPRCGAVESQGKGASTMTERQNVSQVSTQAMVFHGLMWTVRDLSCKCEALLYQCDSSDANAARDLWLADLNQLPLARCKSSLLRASQELFMNCSWTSYGLCSSCRTNNLSVALRWPAQVDRPRCLSLWTVARFPNPEIRRLLNTSDIFWQCKSVKSVCQHYCSALFHSTSVAFAEILHDQQDLNWDLAASATVPWDQCTEDMLISPWPWKNP